MHAVSISVICVTHRKGDLLQASMEGVVRQLQPIDELLVIDDGGEDREVFNAVSAAYPTVRLRYVAVPHQGYRLSLMCNIGIMLAANDLIVKIDGDIVPSLGWLDAYRCMLRKRVLVCGRIEWRLEDGKVARDSRFNYERHQGCVGPRKSYGGNLGFCREDLLSLGLFNTAYNGAWGAEDAEIGEKYRTSDRDVMFCFDAAVEHQWHPLSTFRAGVRRNRQILRTQIRKFERGRLPQPVPRDSLLVMACDSVDVIKLKEALNTLTLPYKLTEMNRQSLSKQFGNDKFVLLVQDLARLDSSSIDQLYAYLKACDGCESVTVAGQERACILSRREVSRGNVQACVI